MQVNKKIAHLSSVHADGDTRIFHKMCASLAKSGADVHLVLAGVDSRKEKNVQIHSVSKAKTRFGRAWLTVNRVFNKAIEVDADIYHIHDPELLRIGLKLVKRGKFVIYDSHEDLPRQILSKDYLKFRRLISYMAEKCENYAAKKMSGIVAATPTIRERFCKLNSRCVTISNYPIVDELFTSDPNSGAGICYVGGIAESRGIYELLTIASENTRIILAGKFASERLAREVENHKNWMHIDYRGFVGREGVKEIFASSSVGVVALHPVANYLEALPIKLFEYMAAGKAVVASNFPLWRSIIVDANCGVCVNPLDPDALREAVLDLLGNEEKARELGKNGRKAVFEKYNWTTEEQKLLDFYSCIFIEV